MNHFLNENMKFDLIRKMIRPEGCKIDEELFENKFVEKMKTFQISKEKGKIDDKVRPPSPDPLQENIKKIDFEIRTALNSEPDLLVVEEIITNLDSALPGFPSPPEVYFLILN